MSKKRMDIDPSKVREIPEGEPFIQLSTRLLQSPAWRSQSINCRRLVDFLIVEHLAHAGRENGNLLATYDQLVDWGITRRLIDATIAEAEALGLIVCHRGGKRNRFTNYHHRFTLTFAKQKSTNDDGIVYYVDPDHQWRRYQPPSIHQNHSCKNPKHKQVLCNEEELERFPIGNRIGSPSGTLGDSPTDQKSQKSANFCDSEKFPIGNPYIYLHCMPPPESFPGDPKFLPADKNSSPNPHKTDQTRPADNSLTNDQRDEPSGNVETLRQRVIAWRSAVGRGANGRLARAAAINEGSLSGWCSRKYSFPAPALHRLGRALDELQLREAAQRWAISNDLTQFALTADIPLDDVGAWLGGAKALSDKALAKLAKVALA